MVARAALVLVLVAAVAAPPATAARLKPFDSCGALVGYAQRNAVRVVEPPGGLPTPVAEREADHSTTNVQEDGVDEPDTVKTDGRRLFVAAGDASERGRTAYRSSGDVPGNILSQWALSEHAGVLRVASTDSESHVTVLRERGKRLAEVGRVSGLGRGEQIHGVRFIGDAGYVVTFRQIDPLYVVDLSDPERPRVRGELKMLGYSAYLHPVGDDLLLGVGQDATEQGRRLGAQLSLFDVSDRARPRRLQQQALAGGSFSAVEWDHRAFLYWPADRLAVLPVEQAAAGFRVARASIDARGSVSQPGTITRSAVIGDRLFTVSDSGVTASPLSTLRGGAWLPFTQGAP